jgi:tetratricopeptide (TPR) repeat protein
VLAAALLALAACRSREPGPEPEALIAQARKLDLEGRHDAAIAAYQEALSRAPDSFSAQYGLARALDLAGRYDEARDHFSRAIALASDSEKDQALRMMGVAWTFVRNVDEAARSYREVFDRDIAAGNFAAAAEVANELARVYLELGDLDRAEDWYRTGHDTAARQTGRAQAQVDLADMRWAHAQARIAARRGNAADARRQAAVVKQLLDKGGIDEQRIQYPYLMGYIEFYLGRYREALADLAQADQQDPFILLLIGQAREKLGDAEGARAAYRQVLESSSHAVSNAIARPIATARLSGRGE